MEYFFLILSGIVGLLAVLHSLGQLISAIKNKSKSNMKHIHLKKNHTSMS